jgi:hypothetical protein
MRSDVKKRASRLRPAGRANTPAAATSTIDTGRNFRQVVFECGSII